MVNIERRLTAEWCISRADLDLYKLYINTVFFKINHKFYFVKAFEAEFFKHRCFVLVAVTAVQDSMTDDHKEYLLLDILNSDIFFFRDIVFTTADNL